MRFLSAVFCLTATATLVLAQAQKESLASLIQEGNRKAAIERIRAGADVNEAQPDGTRPIHWAVYKVDHELLAALIAKKAKVNGANEFGSTPLAEAVKLADAAMVKMLLDAGADPKLRFPKDHFHEELGGKSALEIEKAKKLKQVLAVLEAKR